VAQASAGPRLLGQLPRVLLCAARVGGNARVEVGNQRRLGLSLPVLPSLPRLAELLLELRPAVATAWAMVGLMALAQLRAERAEAVMGR
jgi:hypothetical protein